MKRLLFLAIIVFGLCCSFDATAQILYKVEYGVSIGEYTGQAAGNASQVFGNETLFFRNSFHTGPNITVTEDAVLDLNYIVNNYRSSSLREPVQGDPGCSLSSGTLNYNNTTTSTLTTEWGCVPNMRGRFNVQRIQPLDILNPGPRTFNLCEPAQVRVAIASMSYELRYFDVVLNRYTAFPGYEYPQVSRGRVSPHPGTATLDLNLITDIENYGSIAFEVRYLDNGTFVSQPVTFVIGPCEINLDPNNTNPIGIDATCADSANGGFQLFFERELTDTETLRIVLNRNVSGTFDEFNPTPPIDDLRQNDLPAGAFSYTGLPAGEYQVAWALGSINGGDFGTSDPIAFTVAEPDPLTITIDNTVTPTCIADGQINITPSGGSGNYRYEWIDVNGDIVSEEEDLMIGTPGEYVLRLIDIAVPNNFCFIQSDSTPVAALSDPPTISLIQAFSPSVDNGGSGSIIISLTGGDIVPRTEVNYEWRRNGVIFTPSNNENLTNLQGGMYTISVIDRAGCTSEILEVILDDLPELAVTINQSNFVFCEGETTTLTANVVGGTGDYRFLWSNGAEVDFIAVGPGTYTVTVTDSSDTVVTSTPFIVNYVDRDDTSVGLPGPLSVTVTSITNVTCLGQSNGAIDLDISGGTGVYEVFWDGSPIASTEDRADLGAGTYYYLVRDSNDCELTNFTNQITITEPVTGLQVSASDTDATTNGGNEGTITLTIENGTAPFTFAWERQENDGTFVPYFPVQGTNPFGFNGFIAGTYQVTITDASANTCSASLDQVVIIGEPAQLVLQDPQFIMSPVGCFGESTGSIVARYEGTAPYIFTWRDTDGNIIKIGEEDFLDNQPAGSYTYSIDDSSDAAAIESAPIVITQPTAQLTANSVATGVICEGGNDGTITVTAAGGTGVLQYEINSGLALQDIAGIFTNLEAGTYEITVTDELGCTSILTDIVIDSGIPITAEDINAVTPVSMPGGSDGSISVIVQGGVQPYFYRWTGPNGIETPINTPPNSTRIENLTEGVYTLEVSNTDAFIPDGCYLIRSYTVGEQDAFNVQPLVPEVSCFAADNGSLTATIEATGPVSFRWFNVNDLVNPIAEQTTDERIVTLDGLAPGTYFLEIENTIPQIVRSADIVVEELPEIDVAVAVQATCIEEATGTIDFNPQGAFIDRYTYSINDGATFQVDPVFENLEGGAYNLRVRIDDNADCDLVLTGVTVQDSPVILWDEASTVITRASGPGAADGEIIPAFSGGIPPYQYSIDDGATFQPNPIFSGLGAGTYTVLVTDAAGCSIVSGNMVVTEVGPLTISDILPINALCLGEASGSITATVSGEGTIIYEWTLANGDPVPVSNGINGPNITGILAGNYILTVTDSNSIVVSAPIGIDEPATAVTITDIIPTDVTCFAGNDGTLQIQAAGGTAPYTYSLNGGAYQDSPLFTDLLADDYTVSVQDANGCVFTELVPSLLLEPQPLNIIVNEQIPVTAANQTDGGIFVTVEGGSGTYTYEWTGPNGFTATEEDITNIGAGEYVLTVTDANFAVNNDAGCTLVSDPIRITEPGELIVTVNQTVLLECSGDDFAEITANVQGGVLPYQYQWFQISNGNNIDLQEDTNIIGNLSAGDYFLRIIDANGITVDSDIVTITQPTILQITVDAFTNILCAGQLTGAINISVSGGTPPYQYGWSNGATVPDINTLDAGEYSVEVEDANNCFAEATITISAPDDAIQIVDALVENVSAYEGTDGSIQLNISGGLTPYEYSWTRLSDNLNLGGTPTITNLLADSYAVVISDANGCTLTETYVVTQPDIVEETLVQPSCADSSDGSISVLVNFGNGNFEYLWSTGATENTITNLIAGTYSVTVTGFEAGPITRTYVLENPEHIIINLGSDRVLCQDQTLDLDATVSDATATYSWTSDNGFTSSEPFVTLSQTGNYNLVVRTDAGCTAEGGVSVTVSTDEIDAEFAVSTQAFIDETLIAVDISFPLPEGVEWIIPLGATVVSQNTDAVEFSFTAVGEYEITLITTRGGCVAQKTKKVLVVARDGLINEDDVKNNSKLVEDFIVYPNPTSGRFTADINLTERGEVGIKIFSFANNALVASHKDRGAETYSIPFDISGMPSGVYAVLLETSYGTSLRKIVIR